MIKTDSTRGRIGLTVAHCAGMLDTVALPIWVGTLVASYRFDPQQAGFLVTLFLGGAVLASLLHGFTISCFPHKIRGASAGWTRAVAIFEE